MDKRVGGGVNDVIELSHQNVVFLSFGSMIRTQNNDPPDVMKRQLVGEHTNEHNTATGLMLWQYALRER